MKNKNNYIYIIIFLILNGCSSGVRFSEITQDKPVFDQPVRVLIDSGKDLISLTLSVPKVLYIDKKRTALLKKGDKLFITLVNKKITAKLGNRIVSGNSFDLITADKKDLVSYQNKKYHGLLRFISTNNRLSVINELSLEDYIKGVVPMEMGVAATEKRYEALKAFTIAARTYVVMNLKSRNTFDVYSDVRDQVYGGAGSERVITNRAVNETKNLILKYNQENAVVFYHASCGGSTEDAGNVFARGNIPYLKEVADGNSPNCSISQTFYWSETYSDKDIINFLYNGNYIENQSSQLVDIKVNSRLLSGRVNELLFSVNLNGIKEIKVFRNNIRYLIRRKENNGILRSTMFDLIFQKNNENSIITINGKGNGHGVGMCQWGAIGLAEQGTKYNEIIQFYFKGTTIGKI